MAVDSVSIAPNDYHFSKPSLSSGYNAAVIEIPNTAAYAVVAASFATIIWASWRQQKPKGAKVFYIDKADKGSAEDQYGLGCLYFNGTGGVEKSVPTGIMWLKKAAKQGHTRAKLVLGLIYCNGDGVEKNVEEGLRWLIPAAKSGESVAQFRLAQLYRNGDGVPKDSTEAVRWCRLAAEQGNSEAQLLYSHQLANGSGTPKKPEEAIEWARRAAKQGNVNAQVFFGILVYNLVDNDQALFKEALQFLNRAAEKNHNDASAWIGMYYGFGKGVRQDAAEGVKQVQRAADLGSTIAHYVLAILHEAGDGVPKNEQVAMDWARKAAEANFAPAQEILGLMLLRQSDDADSQRDGFELVCQAAEKGESEAQFKLGELYENGHFADCDLVQAYKWFSLAGAQGNSAAKEAVQRITSLMTREQTASGQQQAYEWWNARIQRVHENSNGQQ